MSQAGKQIIEIPHDMNGQRLDKALAVLLPEFSRSSIQSWIKQKRVVLDDETPQQKDKIYGGEIIEIDIPDASPLVQEPQNLPLHIVHEDDDLLVIYKPAGLVVHPGAGNPDKTLLNALLYHYPDNNRLPRAGIVHRLDKDTSGLMLVARSESARLGLIQQLSDHSLAREYLALVSGQVIAGGTIDEPISRDRHDRRRMAVNNFGKESITHYRVEQRFRNQTLLRVNLETGRTHQIRVHMNHIGFPLIGDPVYGRRLAIAANTHPALEQKLREFKRQALHATEISYTHPIMQQVQRWHMQMPDDMQQLIDACQLDTEQNNG